MPSLIKINAKDLPCPMPLIKLKKAMAENNVEYYELLTTDRGALKDIPAFCELKQLDCELIKEDEDEILFRIKSVRN